MQKRRERSFDPGSVRPPALLDLDGHAASTSSSANAARSLVTPPSGKQRFPPALHRPQALAAKYNRRSSRDMTHVRHEPRAKMAARYGTTHEARATGGSDGLGPIWAPLATTSQGHGPSGNRSRWGREL
eukprot:187912-Pyramimonas_sp.AAC.1